MKPGPAAFAVANKMTFSNSPATRSLCAGVLCVVIAALHVIAGDYVKASLWGCTAALCIAVIGRKKVVAPVPTAAPQGRHSTLFRRLLNSASIVILVVCAALMGWWVQSYHSVDIVRGPVTDGHLYQIISAPGRLEVFPGIPAPGCDFERIPCLVN